jgi:glycosyltransferase involved in cell wall biosynthesis
MRFVFAHNRYVLRGGEDESREFEISMLRARGHEVFEYVVDNNDINRRNLVSIGIRSVWNGDQYQRVRTFVGRTKPDILKVDNYFPLLSPSIFEAAKSMGVATVLSVRNYRLICPAGTLFRSGRICKDCIGAKFALPAIRHRCLHNSYLQTSSVVLSNALSRVRGTWANSVDQYVAVSELVKRLLVSGGFSPKKISVKANSIPDTGPGDGSGKFAIFVGRLIEEKGIRTMLAAWEKVGAKMPLKVIGEGALAGLVQQAASESPFVEYLGRKTLKEVCELIGRAAVLIFPSEWLEPFGRSIVEAYSKGTPVIAANTEGMRDMIEDGTTGLVYRSGDSDDLAEKVLSLAGTPERLERMRDRARERYLKCYSEEHNYSEMMSVFARALANN